MILLTASVPFFNKGLLINYLNYLIGKNIFIKWSSLLKRQITFVIKKRRIIRRAWLFVGENSVKVEI